MIYKYYNNLQKKQIKVLSNKSIENNNIKIKNIDGLLYLKEITNNSVDLILTDPPYIISKESGMDKLYKDVKNN